MLERDRGGKAQASARSKLQPLSRLTLGAWAFEEASSHLPHRFVVSIVAVGFVSQVVEATVEFIQEIGMTLGDEADRVEQKMLDHHLATTRIDGLVSGWGRRLIRHACTTACPSSPFANNE
ncbi:hypothetical protein [Methylorubrum aminovorans]